MVTFIFKTFRKIVVQSLYFKLVKLTLILTIARKSYSVGFSTIDSMSINTCSKGYFGFQASGRVQRVENTLALEC